MKRILSFGLVALAALSMNFAQMDVAHAEQGDFGKMMDALKSNGGSAKEMTFGLSGVSRARDGSYLFKRNIIAGDRAWLVPIAAVEAIAGGSASAERAFNTMFRSIQSTGKVSPGDIEPLLARGCEVWNDGTITLPSSDEQQKSYAVWERTRDAYMADGILSDYEEQSLTKLMYDVTKARRAAQDGMQIRFQCPTGSGTTEVADAQVQLDAPSLAEAAAAQQGVDVLPGG